MWIAVGVAVGCTLIGAVLCILGGISGSKHYFVWRNCGHIFQPKWYQMCVNTHVFDEHRLRCPKCNALDFCGDKGKDPNKL